MGFERYTMIDILLLGVITAVYTVVFYAMWTIYFTVQAIGGPIIARLITYGSWFMPAPLAASLIRRKLSAFLGEFLPALLESIMPTPGGLTNALYGLAQGLFSELAYALFRYKVFNLPVAILAGALPAIPASLLDALLFGEVYPWNYMLQILVAIAISGGFYGAIAYYIARSVRK